MLEIANVEDGQLQLDVPIVTSAVYKKLAVCQQEQRRRAGLIAFSEETEEILRSVNAHGSEVRAEEPNRSFWIPIASLSLILRQLYFLPDREWMTHLRMLNVPSFNLISGFSAQSLTFGARAYSWEAQAERKG